MERYYGRQALADAAGVSIETVSAYRSRGLLPVPDVVIEEGEVASWGWTADTVERWAQNRRSRTGRPPYVRVARDTQTGELIILTSATEADVYEWLRGTVRAPVEYARLLSAAPTNRRRCRRFGRIVEKHIPPLSVVPDVPYAVALARAAVHGITCAGAPLGDILAVVAASQR